MNDLFTMKKKSEYFIDHNLQEQWDIITKGIELLNEYLKVYRVENNSYSRVISILASKSKNLFLSMLSLTLDGFGQEAGAIFRVFIECYELIIYLRLDMNRATDIIRKKPTAGKIAKEIKGQFRDLRDFLNNTSSHFSFSTDSLNHILNYKNDVVKIESKLNEKALISNLRILSSIFISLLIELDNCRINLGQHVGDENTEKLCSLREHHIKINNLKI